ncbi:FadR/GntR family transcriptional regulator [Enterococcus alishanensis]|uniref:GntR family transcriptional regulator n=1 Tax=Enterococcus alishanensis TaxID=1303817 RepID=A0ABS6TGK5_9ENTE|nr:GntR family transcriptional regulator [Enterococcus alishanensis]MBV7392008.1 GntR family transcriptional regulator [Enterococcus alishanensis]
MKNQRNLVNETIEALLNYIAENDLAIGAKMPTEPQLVEMLKVGRSTLREAVKILVYSGVLEVKQGSGTYVKSRQLTTEYTDENLMTVKTMLEIQAAELAAAADLPAERLIILKEKLFERNKHLEEGEFSKYILSDLAFHLQMVELSGNPFLLKWYNEIYPDLITLLSSQILKIDAFQDTIVLHNQVYEGIIEKNPEKARAALIEISQAN